MQKKEKEFTDSFQNVTGLLVTAGQVYTYIDYAAGYNHSWLGGNFVDDFSVGNPDANGKRALILMLDTTFNRIDRIKKLWQKKLHAVTKENPFLD